MSFVSNCWNVTVKTQLIINNNSEITGLIWPTQYMGTNSITGVAICSRTVSYLSCGKYIYYMLFDVATLQPKLWVYHTRLEDHANFKQKELYSFTSSANSFIRTDVPKRISSMSFMKKRNKVGPRTLWRLVMCTESDKQPEIFTTWVLFDINALNHSKSHHRFHDLPIW